MITILQKELLSYIKNGSGFVIAGLFFLVHGIFFSLYTLTYGLTDYGYTTAALELVFLVVVPLLTMGLAAGERSAKTDVLLFTAPLTSVDIVLGKYGAAVIIGAVVTCVAAVFPLAVIPFSLRTAEQTLSATAGFFATWCGFSAMGLRVSCSARTKITAAAQTFGLVLIFIMIDTFVPRLPRGMGVACITAGVVILAVSFFVYRMARRFIPAVATALICSCGAGFYLLQQPTRFALLLPDILSFVSITAREKLFFAGIVDSGALLFFIIWIAVWLFSSVIALETTRRKVGE